MLTHQLAENSLKVDRLCLGTRWGDGASAVKCMSKKTKTQLSAKDYSLLERECGVEREKREVDGVSVLERGGGMGSKKMEIEGGKQG